LAVVIVAAGQSQRFGNPLIKKPFASIQGKAVWLYSAEFFLRRDDVKQVVVVIAAEDHEAFMSQYAANLAVWGIDVVRGGATRGDSVLAGVRQVRPEFSQVAVHDAARPCLSQEVVDRVFRAAQQHRNVIPTIKISSTVKRSADGRTVDATVDRDQLYLAQTPQVFDRTALLEAFQRFPRQTHTDESQLMEHAGHSVHMVEGSPWNLKITTQDDLKLVQQILKLPVRFDAPANPFADDRIWR
jgi:2-C-methyl-D-erythritol 4-phosphate cytidylyltransferase